MNPKYLGDSYDIVKRFFCSALVDLGYSVAIDPMWTGDWRGQQESFYRFVGASPHDLEITAGRRRALLLDPDTGVSLKEGGKYHVSPDRIVRELASYKLVFAFDQSFSRQAKPREVMREKLVALRQKDCRAFYYDSHARFLFAATEAAPLQELRSHLISLGLPVCRFCCEAEEVGCVALD